MSETPDATNEQLESLRAQLDAAAAALERHGEAAAPARLQTDLRLLRTLYESLVHSPPEARRDGVATLADGVQRLQGDLTEVAPAEAPKESAPAVHVRPQAKRAEDKDDAVAVDAAAGADVAAGEPDRPLAVRKPQLVGASPAVQSPQQSAPPSPKPRERTQPEAKHASEKRHASTRRRPPLSPAQRAETIREVTGAYHGFLADELEQMRELEAWRAELQGRDPFPVQELPVYEARAEIIEKLANNRVTLLTGETGSGKTLLAPYLALEAGLGHKGGIVQTEPRRVAARQIARRLSQMCSRKLGDTFGLQTRVDRALSQRTLVKVATDGILLNELRDDPLLSKYELIIIDEAHERSINIDLLLGMMQRILEQRDDLRVLVASATIDEEKFAKFFELGEQQLVRVPGRLYPVELHYHPPEADAGAPDAAQDELEDLPRRAALAVKRIQDEGPGDVLVFMPRVKEIAETIREFKRQGVRLSEIEAIPMHGSLSPEENDRVFQPLERRKVIVATNIAETSITVPGIRWVVDSGFVNLKRYHSRAGISSLKPEWISQASATQRLGRAGRVEDGVCVRLYDDEVYERFKPFTDPEMVRTDLAHVVLYMRDLGIENVRRFPFIDKPDGQQLNNAHRTLVELGALTAARQRESEITPVGKRMAALPLEPSLGRMVIEAEQHGCVEEIVTVAACLSADRDPFVLPPPTSEANLDKARSEVNRLRKEFSDRSSDFVALLNLYREYAKRPWREREQWCRRNYLSIRTLEEASAIRRDLIDALRNHVANGSLKKGRLPSNTDYDAINRCVLAGHVQNVCVAAGKYDYLAVGKHTTYLHPASVYFDQTRRPPIVVARQLERGEEKIFARDLAAVEPHWIEKIAQHLCSYVYEERRYDEKSGRALAKETIYFHDLTLVEDREVDLCERRPEEGLELLVREGLLRKKFSIDADFLRHNERVLDEVKRIAIRLGDRGLIPDEQDEIRFYVRRLDGAKSRKHVESRARREKRLLQMRVSDYLPDELVHNADHWYPREVELAGETVEVEYVDDPFNEVTQCLMSLPVTAVPRLERGELDRLIPGLARRQIEFAARLFNAALDEAHAPDVAAAGIGHDPQTRAVLRVSGVLAGDGATLGDAEVRELVRTFLEPAEAEAAQRTAWEHVVAYLQRTRKFTTVPEELRKAYHEALQRERMAAYVEVHRADGSRLRVSHDFDELRRSVDLERLKKAWDAARESVETPYSDRYQDIPPLLDGLLDEVHVAQEHDGTAVNGYVGLDAGHAEGKIARKLFDSHEAALKSSQAALAQLGRWHLLLDPNLHMRLQQFSVPEELDQRYYAATGARENLAGKLRQLLIRSGSDAGCGADEIAAGEATLMPRLAALRARLPQAIREVAEILDEVLDAYDEAYKAVRKAGAPPELATPLEAETVRLRELERMSFAELAPLRARLETLAELALQGDGIHAEAAEPNWIEAQLERAAAQETLQLEQAQQSAEALKAETNGSPGKRRSGNSSGGKPVKKRKKKSKDAPPDWVAPPPSARAEEREEKAQRKPATQDHEGSDAVDATATTTSTKSPAQPEPGRAKAAVKPSKEEQRRAQREAFEALQRERVARNREGYARLIAATSDGDSTLCLAAASLLEALAEQGHVSLERAIQWDADAASEAELATLLTLDDEVETWILACSQAKDAVLADCRLQGESPSETELAKRIAQRAQRLLKP